MRGNQALLQDSASGGGILRYSNFMPVASTTLQTIIAGQAGKNLTIYQIQCVTRFAENYSLYFANGSYHWDFNPTVLEPVNLVFGANGWLFPIDSYGFGFAAIATGSGGFVHLSMEYQITDQ